MGMETRLSGYDVRKLAPSLGDEQSRFIGFVDSIVLEDGTRDYFGGIAQRATAPLGLHPQEGKIIFLYGKPEIVHIVSEIARRLNMGEGDLPKIIAECFERASL